MCLSISFCFSSSLARRVVSADGERQQQGPQSLQQRHQPAADRGTIDHQAPDDTGRPEGLFTELESAMDAASAHLLAAEAVVDTTSPYDANVIDRMVSVSVIVIHENSRYASHHLSASTPS